MSAYGPQLRQPGRADTVRSARAATSPGAAHRRSNAVCAFVVGPTTLTDGRHPRWSDARDHNRASCALREDQGMIRSTLALVAVLSVTSVSLAGDLVTPPMFVGLNTTLTCKLANISSNTITAQIQLVDAASGTVLQDTSPFMVNAGQLGEIFAVEPGKILYCRFVKASKSKVRASITSFVSTDDGTDHVVVAAQ
jgi:hypothetical protein